MSLAYINGRFLPLEEVTVPAMDRGFLFGDGVYEVVPVYSRRPFRMEAHFQRLARSLGEVRIPDPHTPDQWRILVERVVAGQESEDQSVYVQVTRGVAPVRNHAFPEVTTPTVFMMSEPLPPPSAALKASGVTAVSAADNRWHRCDIKATSLLANCLLRQASVDAGATETVLFRDGMLSEGSASNIFVVRNDVLYAPQKNHLMLSGITYDVVLELAAAHGLNSVVGDITSSEVRAADELWLSSSTKEILPIVRLDGRPIGNGTPGPWARRMMDWYQDFKTKVMRNGG
jgi:D-alanine transaminase